MCDIMTIHTYIHISARLSSNGFALSRVFPRGGDLTPHPLWEMTTGTGTWYHIKLGGYTAFRVSPHALQNWEYNLLAACVIRVR